MYRWAFNGVALAELDGLPREAQLALAEFLSALETDPWEFGRREGEIVDRSKGLRDAPFGRAGTVWFVVLDWDELCVVVSVVWAG